MVRSILATIMVVLCCSGCMSGGGGKLTAAAPGTPLADFEQDARIAEWLGTYQEVMQTARKAARGNPAITQVTREAFAVQQEGVWYALFGRFDGTGEGAFTQLACYRVDPIAGIAVLDATARPVEDAVPYMRALDWTYVRVVAPNLQNDGLLFDQFVRVDAYGNVVVWLLPSWQPNGFVLYGRTLMYMFTPDGAGVIHQQVWDYGLTGLRPRDQRRYTIGNSGYMRPTVGDLYFILYYGKLFDGVMARSRTHGTTIAMVGDQPRWVHMPLEGDGATLVGPVVPVVGPMSQDQPEPQD